MTREIQLHLRNHTAWSTPELKALVLAGLKAEKQTGIWWVSVTTARRSELCLGKSYGGGHQFRLMIPAKGVRVQHDEGSWLELPAELISGLGVVVAAQVQACTGVDVEDPGAGWVTGMVVRKAMRSKGDESDAMCQVKAKLAEWEKRAEVARVKVGEYRQKLKELRG
jgi:hypothetical protein